MPKRRIIGFTLASLHLGLFAWIVSLILSGREPSWPMYWLILYGVDFPVILLAAVLSPIARFLFGNANAFGLADPIGDIQNFILPAIVCGIGGTLWWFYLPTLFTKAISDKKFGIRTLLIFAALILVIIGLAFIKKMR